MVEVRPRDLIFHSDDPSPFQAFHFGAHRALQASQTYRRFRDARPHNARVQWTYLDRVWKHYDRTGDPRLGLAILAADMVFRRELPATVNEYSDPLSGRIRERRADRGRRDSRAPRWPLGISPKPGAGGGPSPSGRPSGFW